MREDGGRREDSGDALLVGGLAVLAFIFFFTLAWWWARGFHDSYDLGYFRQAAFLIAHGHSPFVTIRGLNLLADHAYVGFFPIALLTRILPVNLVLVGVQAGALALGVVPLWLIARRHARLSAPLCVALVVAYVAFPATQNLNMFDFHPEVVATPALLFAVLLYLERRIGLAAIAFCIALLFREDVGLVAIGLGALLWIRGDRRLALITAAGGLGWFVLTTQLVMPHFAAGQVTQAMRFSQYGKSTGAVVRFAVTHPFRIVGDLLSHQTWVFLVSLLVPIALLPLFAPTWLLPIVPIDVAYLLSNQPAAHDVRHQYTATVIPFVFVAAAFGLARIVREVPRLGRLGRTIKPHAATLAICVLLVAVVVGQRVTDHGLPQSPWNWPHQGSREQAMRQASHLIPTNASVSASIRMWDVLPPRVNLYNFPMPWVFYGNPPGDPVPLAVRESGVQWIAVDTSDAWQWFPTYAQALPGLAAQQGFDQVFSKDGIFVFHRTPKS